MFIMARQYVTKGIHATIVAKESWGFVPPCRHGGVVALRPTSPGGSGRLGDHLLEGCRRNRYTRPPPWYPAHKHRLPTWKLRSRSSPHGIWIDLHIDVHDGDPRGTDRLHLRRRNTVVDRAYGTRSRHMVCSSPSRLSRSARPHSASTPPGVFIRL